MPIESISDIKYTMITDFQGYGDYWNHVNGKDEAYFSENLLFNGVRNREDLKNEFLKGTPQNTLFIQKVSKTTQVESVKIGTAEFIKIGDKDKQGRDRYYFRVKLEKECKVDHTESRFSGVYTGVSSDYEKYISQLLAESSSENSTSVSNDNDIVAPTSMLFPAFFERFSTIETLYDEENSSNFETYTYYLLKLLGISNIHKFERKGQAGKSDGFFRLGNLAVFYDCTLNKNFGTEKDTQILNFCNQLEKGSLKVERNGINETLKFSGCDKQVWVITLNSKGRILDIITEIKKIEIKEVIIDDLKKIYEDRLLNFESESELEDKLKGICSR